MKNKIKNYINFIACFILILAPLQTVGANTDSWTKISENNLTDACYSIIDMVTYNGDLYATCQASAGTVFKYTGASWSSITTDGFGDQNNNFAHKLVVFNGYLYTGTLNYDTGGEVWRYDGGSWAQVNTDGFGNNENLGVMSLEVYDGNLYAGTHNIETGANVYRYTGGTSWSAIYEDGFGDNSNAEVSVLKVFDGKMFIAFDNANGAEAWTWDGSNVTWINPDGFGAQSDPDYFVSGFEEYDNSLYASTMTITSSDDVLTGRVYRYDGNTDWTQVNTDNFGAENTFGVRDLAAFDGCLYVTVLNTTGGNLVYKYDGANWQLATDGIAETETYASALSVDENNLYLSTSEPGEGPYNAKVWIINGRQAVDNPPTFTNLPNSSDPINITEGQTITTNPFTIKVKPTDDSGIVKVEFYVDDNKICTATNGDSDGVYSCDWDTSKYHSQVRVYAFDTNNNRSEVLLRNALVDPTLYAKELPETGRSSK